MLKRIVITVSALLLLNSTPLSAQDEETTAPEGGSSQQVEQSDDDFRRRMELEDARSRDPGFANPVDAYKPDLEKIDKLPEESRDNIRDQLIDVIMEEGEWEPGDALKEYPYKPTAAAEGDPALKQQEQEAWNEQIEKYHQRESEAYGAYRGPVPGPGNPTGQEGGGQQNQQGGESGGQQGAGQDGQQGGEGEQGEDSDAGTYEYQPGSSSSADETSTAGVSESALDFLRGRQSAQAAQQGQPQSGPPGQAQAEQQQQAQQEPTAEQSNPQQQPDPEQESEPDTRGIIAIEDLDKLRGNTVTPPPPEEEDP